MFTPAVLLSSIKYFLIPPGFDRTAWNELHITILSSALFSIVINIPIVIIVTISFTGTIPNQPLFIWCGLITTVSLLRILLIPYYKRRITLGHQVVSDWVLINRIGLLLTGGLWGIMIVFNLYPLAPYHELLIGFMVLGLAGGTAASNAANTLNLLFFISPLLLPMIYWYALNSHDELHSLSILITIYFIYLVAISTRSQQVFLMNTALRQKNESLLDEFQSMNNNLKHEIDGRRHIEKELTVAKDVAENANQAKSEFLSSMSHELRTPLNAIIGFSEIVMEEEASPDISRFINNIHSAGQHLHALIDEILDLARIEAGRIDLKQELFDLNSLIEDCLRLIGPQAELRGISVDYSGAPTKIQNDRMRTKQVLLNILSNAVKYNHEHGSVRVMLIKEGSFVEIYIIDKGVGIPADKLDALYQPFNRLSHEFSNIEGSGLGLAITKHLVDLMGGEIRVESKPGVGSTFIVKLPL